MMNLRLIQLLIRNSEADIHTGNCNLKVFMQDNTGRIAMLLYTGARITRHFTYCRVHKIM